MIVEPVPETKSEVSVTFQKNSKTEISGFEYAETGDTCTITMTGKVYATSDPPDGECVMIQMNPDKIKITKAGEESSNESLRGDMNRMMSKRKWRPGTDG